LPFGLIFPRINGLRIGRNKTEYKEYDFGGRYQDIEGMKRPMKISGNVMVKIEGFKYLKSFIQKDGSFGMDVIHRINIIYYTYIIFRYLSIPFLNLT
jgi:hypothetical protein